VRRNKAGGIAMRMQLPLTHPHRIVDQHVVVTVLYALYACDIAGSNL